LLAVFLKKEQRNKETSFKKKGNSPVLAKK
jgi:hypothetical protein